MKLRFKNLISSTTGKVVEVEVPDNQIDSVMKNNKLVGKMARKSAYEFKKLFNIES